MHKPRCQVSTAVGIRGRCAGEGNSFDSDMHALGNHGGEDGGWRLGLPDEGDAVIGHFPAPESCAIN